ncbi:unnamed protein product [Coccothraustes coccothraustes]
MVATLGELLAILRSLNQEMRPFVSPGCLYRELEKFTRELRATLYSIDDTWRRPTVTSDDDDRVTSLSQALAAYKSTPWTYQNRVTMAASEWQGSVSVLMNSWARLAGKAIELRNAWREVATTQTRDLQDEASRYRTAQENLVELGLALSRAEKTKMVARHEAWVRRDARVAASQATGATMESPPHCVRHPYLPSSPDGPSPSCSDNAGNRSGDDSDQKEALLASTASHKQADSGCPMRPRAVIKSPPSSEEDESRNSSHSSSGPKSEDRWAKLQREATWEGSELTKKILAFPVTVR